MADGKRISAGNRRRVQVRKERKDAFNDQKKQIVLDHLAACCNMLTAAEAAGVTSETVNAHRRKDPVFAQQVIEAIEAGYQMLDTLTLERAAKGGRYEPGKTPVPGPETIDTGLAVHLLQLRHRMPGRRTGDSGPKPRRVTEKELKEAILQKLELLAKRLRNKKSKLHRRADRAGSAGVKHERGLGDGG